MAGQLAAFMSYARFDDQHDDGQLTAFRERLAAEVRVQTGEEFLIFQDRADIAWGQNWQQRISQALDTVTLLLVIITPGFFRSPHCRAETEQFLDRERQLGRDDLILPVYYVSTPQIDDLRKSIVEGAIKPKTRVTFETGDEIRVIDGAFANFSGTVEEVKPDKQKLRVKVSIFGRATPVELDFLQVEKI